MGFHCAGIDDDGADGFDGRGAIGFGSSTSATDPALALANAWLFSRLKQSPIVGYLVTGLLVGPYGFHLVRGVHEVELAAEAGVILLLFTIGLEFSYSRIVRLKGLLLAGGSVQLAATALAVALLALRARQSIGVALARARGSMKPEPASR